MRRKIAASNAMVLKSNCKLRKLDIGEVKEFICQKNVDCVRVLTKKHPLDFEGASSDCRPDRLCHMLASSMQVFIQGSDTFDPPVIFRHNFAKPEGWASA